MAKRKIIHLDLDAFFCAVEELYDPSLAGKPFAVGGSPDSRGVVASCSYAARKYGIHSAMPMAHAVRKCPELIIVNSHYRNYSEFSRKVMKKVEELTPLVEKISIDESFLDVSDLPDSGEQIARELQSSIRNSYGLPCSLGVASNKLVAKIANDFGKASYHGNFPPNAITVVPFGGEAEFLAPLPVNALWGIGPKSSERLIELGISTIGDLALISEKELKKLFGKHGSQLAKRAKGIDDRPVETSHVVKSVSHEKTFSRDISDLDTLRRTLLTLSENVGLRMRRNNKFGKTVKIKLRWSDFSTITRQTSLEYPTNQGSVIFNAVYNLFLENWPKGKPVRLLGVGVGGFETPMRQLSFWEDPSFTDATRETQLLNALDTLRERFGDQIIKRASNLNSRKKN